MRRTLEQKQIVWNALGYKPTPAALAAHGSESRFTLIAGGIRGSKSLSAAREATPHACEPNQLGWIIGPDYEQCRPEFSYLHDDLAKLGLVAESWQPRQGGQALRTLLGTNIQTKTTDDVRKLASFAPDWIIVCEAAQCDFEIYYKCIERLAEKRGWLWLSGTFEKAQGWYVDLFNRWQGDNVIGGRSFSLPSWSNLYAFPGGRNDPEIKLAEAELPPDLFMERFGGVPCKLANLVLKEFDYTQHVFDWVRFDPEKPVEIAVDPGYGGSNYAVEFVQEHTRAETRRFMPSLSDLPFTDVWVIDEIYTNHAITQDVINAARQTPYWDKLKGGVGDIASEQHHSNPSVYDVWSANHIYLRGRKIAIEDNVGRHRTFLREPLSGAPRLFYSPRCKGALGEYGRWRRKQLGENMYGEPEKINCDALKAIGYWLIDRFGSSDKVVQALPKQRSGPYWPYAE